MSARKRKLTSPGPVAVKRSLLPPAGTVMHVFLTDAYDRRPSTKRREIEQRIRELRMQMWSSPEDRRELEGMIEAAERELRALDRKRDTA
jgi:hypothetical protein